jgi:hypothetical protein
MSTLTHHESEVAHHTDRGHIPAGILWLAANAETRSAATTIIDQKGQ